MKHPIAALALASFAVAASAQAAAPSDLAYNRVTLSLEGQNGNVSNNISVSALLGSSNLLATVSTTDMGNNGGNFASLAVGYVFKNAAYSTDAIVSISTGTEFSNPAYSLLLRRPLNEVATGLEVAVGYTFQRGIGAGANYDSVTAEVSYNLNKTWSIAYGLIDTKAVAQRNVVYIRHNF